MIYSISNQPNLELNTIVLDLNGTLSVNGRVPGGVKGRIAKLKKLGFHIILFTGDQRGTASKICDSLKIEFVITRTGAEKESEMRKLDGQKCVAIGNARIDNGTFQQAKLAILTLQKEGIHVECLKFAHIIVPSINDALDLLLHPDSLAATLKC